MFLDRRTQQASIAAVSLSVSSLAIGQTSPPVPSPENDVTSIEVLEKRTALGTHALQNWAGTTDLSVVLLVTCEGERDDRTFRVIKNGEEVLKIGALELAEHQRNENKAKWLRFSPDGEHFYYAQQGVARSGDWSRPTGMRIVYDGTPGRVFSHVGNVSWSSDGKYWGYHAFDRKKGGHTTLYIVRNGEVVFEVSGQDSATARGETAAFHTDGSFACAYPNLSGTLVLNRNGTEQAYPGQSGNAYFDPKGRCFVDTWTTAGSTLYVNDREVLRSKTLKFVSSASGAFCAVGRDFGDNDSRLEFLVYQQNADGQGQEFRFATDPAVWNLAPSASPDGLHWVVPLMRNSEAILMVDGVQVGPLKGTWEDDVIWSSTGGHYGMLIELHKDFPSQPLRQHIVIDGKLYGGYDQIQHLTFSADGKRSGFFGQIKNWYEPDSARWLVIDGKNFGVYKQGYEIAFSPSGQHVAYCATTGGEGSQMKLYVDGTVVADARLVPGSLRFLDETQLCGIIRETVERTEVFYRCEWTLVEPVDVFPNLRRPREK